MPDTVACRARSPRPAEAGSCGRHGACRLTVGVGHQRQTLDWVLIRQLPTLNHCSGGRQAASKQQPDVQPAADNTECPDSHDECSAQESAEQQIVSQIPTHLAEVSEAAQWRSICRCASRSVCVQMRSVLCVASQSAFCAPTVADTTVRWGKVVLLQHACLIPACRHLCILLCHAHQTQRESADLLHIERNSWSRRYAMAG